MEPTLEDRERKCGMDTQLNSFISLPKRIKLFPEKWMQLEITILSELSQF